jgi:hypothetical protein
VWAGNRGYRVRRRRPHTHLGLGTCEPRSRARAGQPASVCPPGRRAAQTLENARSGRWAGGFMNPYDWKGNWGGKVAPGQARHFHLDSTPSSSLIGPASVGPCRREWKWLRRAARSDPFSLSTMTSTTLAKRLHEEHVRSHELRQAKAAQFRCQTGGD